MKPRPFQYNPPEEPHLAVLYRDADILVVNKQSGLLSVPGKPAEHADCLESRAQALYPGARIIHRLDLDTSGVMVLALNAQAHRNIGLQFEKRRVEKEYIARLWGHLEPEEGELSLPLRCDWPNRPKQMVDHQQGKPARTAWQVIGRDEISTTVRLFPKTGRSHQLRIHMLELGHPILGDNLYAHEDALNAAGRLRLHAVKLIFTHPATRERIEFTTPVPFETEITI